MTINEVVRGTNSKPVSSGLLAQHFESRTAHGGGMLFVGYPITTTVDRRGPLDAVYVSPTKGVVLFDLVEGTDLGDVIDRQDDAFNRLEIRLKQHAGLVSRRQLMIPIHTVTYAPGVSVVPDLQDSDHPVATNENLESTIGELDWPGCDEVVFRNAVSALQSVSSIRASSTPRPVTNQTSRGAKLKLLEESIATLDHQQSKAVIETIDGVQRIRGLAGSGKTIVLALKAAYLHATHPEWDIAVTYNARSLSDQFRRLINTFTIAQTQEEPDWSKVHVLNSWGSGGGDRRDGVYRKFCTTNNVPFYDFGRAKNRWGQRDAFGQACSDALTEASNIIPQFDAILVDEAQDLPPSFLRMCYEMLRGEKRLVYAYDELQTLAGTGLPPAEEIFGVSPETEKPRVSFDPNDPDVDRKDIILQKCYRNSRPVLVTAHALGFGVYRTPPPSRTTGLVQIFEQKELWGEIGYDVLEGSLTEGQDVTLSRTGESSPQFLEAHSDDDDLIQFIRFDSVQKQNEWLADEIQRNVTTDELLATDIIVINPDPYTTRPNLGPIMASLYDRQITSHLAGVDTAADVFFRRDEPSVTFTGIYRAKGNEAGMVYVTNAHESIANTGSLATIRNRLFTAITRSKAWVRVTGVGEDMDRLIDEFSEVKRQNFRLAFRYPTEVERTTMQIVHRDLSRAEVGKVRRADRNLNSILEDLDSGEIHTEDIDPATRERLVRYLTQLGQKPGAGF
ncbi:DEAD/DEAH box helicase [Nocardioides alkalitolerans]|uniref:DEAD/DEAH box helicase n=1 Tax=Nocardioides alkalitolerans TaxID=281714 RepID=UPI001B7FD475|nr:ATP-binding domain-containing protein [Nocardioides alkalitolerans]